jgi:hypothetical protein
MPLKLKKSQTLSEPSATKDAFSGPWGRINPEPQSVVVLRLCKKTSPSTEETYSYPYRVLSSWHWRGVGAQEELKIEAGSELVTIKGRGLDRMVEALDRGTLEILREIEGGRQPEENNAIWVSAIEIGDRTK